MHYYDLLQKVINGSTDIDSLSSRKSEFENFALKILNKPTTISDEELRAFLQICLDYYAMSENGDVLISDSIYDQCMQEYTSRGNEMLFLSDTIGKKKWDFIKHEIPGVVGTISKCYDYKDLKNYLRKYSGVTKFTLAPKYDGISCAIRVRNGQVVSAATRYNGIMGQNITQLIKNARNSENFIFPQYQDGYYKCELCVDTEAFGELIKIKNYSNRRSATAGIVNTPTNLQYAEFVTIVPLIFYDNRRCEMYNIAPYQKVVQYYSPSDLMDDIERMLEDIRSEEFPFRVDGVVISPDRSNLGDPNEFDLMDNSIAFKINTAEGKTKIEFGYMSVGRLGNAIPMLRVAPVEVNETIVTDVSLGSYDKFLSMGLHEGEEVIVYSAGDVIPQIKLPTVRANLYNAPDLKIRRRCPYCGEKLERANTEYYCGNPECPRVITGRISNFLIKMGLEGFSDKSVEMVYDALKIRSITEFIMLQAEDIMKVDGFEIVSATNFANELTRLRNTPVSVAKFFGALGIDKISEKKSRKIFEYVTVDELMNAGNKKLDKIFWELQCSDGIGAKTASSFIEYVRKNHKEIEELLNIIPLTGDIKYKHNVVFTGFRPTKEIEQEFNNLGIEVSNSVSKSTLVVITATTERDSVKSKAAISKGIPIVHASELDSLLDELRRNGF